MNPEDELYTLLMEYDKLASAVSEVLAKPHALDTIRMATQTFHKNLGRYPHGIHSVLDTYLENCRRQELFGTISHGGD